MDKLGSSFSFLFERGFWIEKIYNIFKKFNIESTVDAWNKSLIEFFSTVKVGLISLKKIAGEFAAHSWSYFDW